MNSAESPPRSLGTRNALLWTIGLAGVIIAAVLILSAGGGKSSQEEPEAKILPVETLVISPVESFQQRRTFTGVIKSARSSELGFDRTGRLASIEVEEGEHVAAGQILARLDIRNLEAKRRELQAQRAAAQASLDELVAGPREETIEAARAEVRDWEAQVKLAELQDRRGEELVRDKVISQDEYEQRSLGKQSAQARLDAAQRRLDELEAGTRKEQLAAQRAMVAQLEAAIENVEVDLEESVLTAPYAGAIAQRNWDEGTILSPGASLLRIVENGRLEAWIGLPPSAVAQLPIGSQQTVEVSGQKYAAVVSGVLPELDVRTRTRTAILQLDDSQNTVAPAQIVRLEVRETSRLETPCYWLPTTALTRGGRGLWAVLAVETDPQNNQEIAVRRDVELLHTDGQRVLVRGTLADGERVIVQGTHRLVAGQRVASS